MTSEPPPETITGEVALTVAGDTMTVRVTVPIANTALTDLLPIFQELTSTLVDRAVERDAAPGRSVSCRAGCGACCRQPVPIAPSEARGLVALIDAMAEERRTAVHARFADSRSRLAAAGITTLPDSIARLDLDEQVQWGADYLTAGVACPFLEDESCSIHPVRPTICREYLVTTPAENCRKPSAEDIRRVPIPGSVSSALFAVDRALENHGRLLLVDALDWVAAHPAAIVQTVFATLAAKS
jgi:Fe-S-cluster containining protein